MKSKFPEWINGGSIERMALDEGYKASNVSRRCKDLTTEGQIEIDYKLNKNGIGCAIYRWKPRTEVWTYIVPKELRILKSQRLL